MGIETKKRPKGRSPGFPKIEPLCFGKMILGAFNNLNSFNPPLLFLCFNTERARWSWCLLIVGWTALSHLKYLILSLGNFKSASPIERAFKHQNALPQPGGFLRLNTAPSTDSPRSSNVLYWSLEIKTKPYIWRGWHPQGLAISMANIFQQIEASR